MNQRIKLLAEQAGLEWGPGGYADYSDFDHSLFAELIVRECADVGSKFSMAHPEDIRYQIKRHFGVEQ